MDPLIVFLIIFIVFLLVIIFASGVRIIRPWEVGLKIVLGRYVPPPMKPGFHWVVPFITQVVRMDLREQTWDVPKQEVITKDNSPTAVDAVIYIKVVDPEKAFFEVQNYKLATINLAMTTLRSVIGDMELDEILYNRAKINATLRQILDEATDKWGVKVTAVEIKEVDPSPTVKSAMEEQTAAERQRRAAILRADGVKRSQILEAEGAKRAMILKAEGERKSKILKAEGERLATILRAQGEAQKLRILALGSATLDPKSLTVLSFETVKSVANGQATKIIFPFEFSKLFESVSEYVGGTKALREHSPVDYQSLEKLIGEADKVLGPIPSYEEIEESLRKRTEEEGEAETSEEDIRKLLSKKATEELLKENE